MRTWRFLFGVSLLGAGAAAVACSSSSSPPPTGGGDASADTGPVVTEDGGGDAACVPITLDGGGMPTVTTIDGGTLWGCYETKCSSQLAACASDCVCNNAFITALAMIAAMPSSATAEIGSAAVADTNAGAVGTCVIEMLNNGMCAGEPTGDGGTDGAAKGDAPSDSATASDAPAEGG